MKLNYCFYCFLIISLIASSATGQKSDSSRTNVIDSSNLVETKKIVSELKDKIDSLLNKKETEKTGRFKFYNPSPSVFSKQEFEKLRSEKTIDDKLFEKDLKQIRKGKTSSYTRLVATLFKPLISQNDIIEAIPGK